MHAPSKLLLLTFSGVAFAALAIACSSSGGSGGSGSVSSVDSTKTVNGLSDSEAKQYCEDATRYAEGQLSAADSKKIGCGFSSQFMASFNAESDSDAQTKCKALYEECLKKPDEKTETDAGASDDPCTEFKSRSKDCAATVGEVTQCMTDELAAMKALAARDFCAEAKASSPDGGTPGSSLFEQPASCKAIESKCPGLSGKSESDGPASDG